MNLQPLADKVVILPDARLSKTNGGLLLPDNAEYRPRFGRVLAVGPGKWQFEESIQEMVKVPMSVVVGDRVAFSHYGTDGIEVDGEEYLIIREERILAIIPPGEEVPEFVEAGPMRKKRG